MDNVGVTLRLIARTLPMKHWGVERALRKVIKKAFDENNIEISYPIVSWTRTNRRCLSWQDNSL